MLNDIAALEAEYENQKHEFEHANYDKNIAFLIDHHNRQKVEKILSIDKFAPLAVTHNCAYGANSVYDKSTKTWVQPILDLYEMAIPDNRYNALTSFFNGCPYINDGLIRDFCNDVKAEMLYDQADAKIEQMKVKKSNKQRDILQAQSALENAIVRALDSISSIEAERFNQLFESTEQGDTLGHFCLRAGHLLNSNIYARYGTLLSTLSSEHIYCILLKRNRAQKSILFLYLASKLNFIDLAHNLSADHLSLLLFNTRLFEKLIVESDYTKNFLGLLKVKFKSSSTGLAQLSKILDLDNESLTPVYNGWTVAYHLLKSNDDQYEDAILHYIDLLLLLPRNKIERCFEQANIEGETFVALLLQRGRWAMLELDADNPQRAISISLIVRLLYHFKFSQKTINQLANIQHLKKEVGAYLLTLQAEPAHLVVLKYSIDKGTSLGLFFRALRGTFSSFSGMFFPQVFRHPIVHDIGDHLSSMEQSLSMPAVHRASNEPPAVQVYENYT